MLRTLRTDFLPHTHTHDRCIKTTIMFVNTYSTYPVICFGLSLQLLSCQPRVTVTTYFVYKVIRAYDR